MTMYPTITGIVMPLVLGMTLLVSPSQAQTYRRTTFPLGMTSIEGDAGTVVQISALKQSDDFPAIMTLPFSFEFFGQSVSSINVIPNGAVSFGPFNNTFSFVNLPIPSPTVAPPPNFPPTDLDHFIAPFHEDFAVFGGSNSQVLTKIEGSSPNRIMIIEFKALTLVDELVMGQATERVTGQIRLFEGSHIIELHYAPHQSWTGVRATIGLENIDGSAGYLGSSERADINTPPLTNFRFDPNPVAGIDLAADIVRLSEPSALPGDSITVARQLSNLGTDPAGAFRLGFYLSTDALVDTTDTLLGSFDVASMAANSIDGLVTVPLTIPANTTPGAFFIGMIVDDLSQVAESDETNNASPVLVPFDVGSPVDLALDPITLSATSIEAGNGFLITRSFANLGGARADRFHTTVYLSDDTNIVPFDFDPFFGFPAGVDLILKTDFIDSLSAGASQGPGDVFCVIPEATPPGPYFIALFLDDRGQLTESDEANNLELVAITVTAPAGPPNDIDLGVNALTANQTRLSAGDSITLTRTISNLGSQDSGPFQVGVYLSSNPGFFFPEPLLDTIFEPSATLIDSFMVNNLPAGTSDGPADITVTIPANTPPDNYAIGLYLDNEFQISEVSEFNGNLVVVPLTIDAVGPDLIVDQLQFNQFQIIVGDSLFLSRQLSNIGAANTGPTRASVVLSANTTITPADFEIGSVSISDIAAGASDGPADFEVVVLSIPSNNTNNIFNVGLIVDPDSTLPEFDEGNNTGRSLSQIEILPQPQGPELIVRIFETATTQITVGDSLTVSRRLVNIGAGDAGPFRVGFYLSDDPVIDTNDFLIDSEDIPALVGNGAVGPSDVTITIPTMGVLTGSMPRNFFLGALVDDLDAVTETSELNNSRADPDLIDVRPVAQPGDVNFDGAINIFDVQVAINQVLALIPTTPEADVNTDGQVDILDVQAIINFALAP